MSALSEDHEIEYSEGEEKVFQPNLLLPSQGMPLVEEPPMEAILNAKDVIDHKRLMSHNKKVRESSKLSGSEHYPGGNNSIIQSLRRKRSLSHKTSASASPKSCSINEETGSSSNDTVPSPIHQSLEYQLRERQARADMLKLLEDRLRAKCSKVAPSTMQKHSSSAVARSAPSSQLDTPFADDSNPQAIGSGDKATDGEFSSTGTSQGVGTAKIPQNLRGSDERKKEVITRSDRMLRQTARILEQQLFEQAHRNLHDYQNLTTLDARLGHLRMALVARKNIGSSNQSSRPGLGFQRTCGGGFRKRKQPSPEQVLDAQNTKHLRIRVFKEILGGENQYQEVSELVKDIRTAQVKLAASLGGCGHCRESPAATPASANVASTLCVPREAFGEQIPKAVRQLYFETRLVECFERYPVESLSKVPWESMIQQAQTSLLSFRMWEMQLEEPQGTFHT